MTVASTGGPGRHRARVITGSGARKSRSARFAAPAVPIAVAIVLSCATQFFFLNDRDYGNGAGIMAYTGWAMSQGRTIYRETWENKGPLLYLINELGVRIDYWHGIFVLELGCLVATAALVYALARQVTGRVLASAASSLALLTLGLTLSGGNLVEEYSMPFACTGVLAAVRLTLGRGRRWPWAAAYGACLALIVELRFNIVAVPGAFAIFALVALTKRNGFGRMMGTAGVAVGAMGVAGAPVAWYLARRGALRAAIRTAYTGVMGDWGWSGQQRFEHAVGLLGLFLGAAGVAALLVAFTCLAVAALRRHDRPWSPRAYLVAASALALVANVGANSLSGNGDMNYYITFVPALAVPYAWTLERGRCWLNEHWCVGESAVAVLAAASIVIGAPGVARVVSDVQGTNSGDPAQYEQAYAYVDAYTTPRQTVQVFGAAGVQINYGSQRLSASKYPYDMMSFLQPRQRAVNAAIAETVIEGKPAMVLFPTTAYVQTFEQALTSAQRAHFKAALGTLYQEPETVPGNSYVSYRLKA
ncbi:MAG: hypothetical protein LBM66_07970 [Bifidobacteriaceae bacterium]|jgi:4-amino-4-deoxy-L-arabinose transferase-like glycosyltransferase|nr:hypothetical protein [Bifidobacteriaceae bacterium]